MRLSIICFVPAINGCEIGLSRLQMIDLIIRQYKDCPNRQPRDDIGASLSSEASIIGLFYTTAQNCNTPYRTALLRTVQGSTDVHFTVLHCCTLHRSVMQYTALHCTALHCNTLHCIVLNSFCQAAAASSRHQKLIPKLGSRGVAAKTPGMRGKCLNGRRDKSLGSDKEIKILIVN